MSVDKLISSADDALYDVAVGAAVMIGGCGRIGVPHDLVSALIRRGVSHITCISQACYSHNNDPPDVASLVANGQVAKLITAPLPGKTIPPDMVLELARQDIAIEIIEQGLLAERIRSAGAGVGAFLIKPHPNQSNNPVLGQPVDQAKETQIIDGDKYVFENALRADVALIRAYKSDPLGNLIYKDGTRNWNHVMATAASVVVVQVDQVVQVGDLNPELIITPGIYIDHIVTA